MDAFLTAVLQAAPSWGVGGLLVAYIVILIRREARVDDKHAAELDQRDRLHASELERLNRDHDAELAELKTTIRELRQEVRALDQHIRSVRAEQLGLTLPIRRHVEVVDEGVLDGTERLDP